jgi:hypothetical protein
LTPVIGRDILHVRVKITFTNFGIETRAPLAPRARCLLGRPASIVAVCDEALAF